MPAHIKASLLGSTLTLPIAQGRPALGTWQGIYLCEHRDDGGPSSIVGGGGRTSPAYPEALATVAVPDRGALLGECGCALAGIIGGEDRFPDRRLALKRLGLRPVEGIAQDPLATGKRERAVGSDVPANSSAQSSAQPGSLTRLTRPSS